MAGNDWWRRTGWETPCAVEETAVILLAANGAPHFVTIRSDAEN
jgi:hypothetical protein